MKTIAMLFILMAMLSVFPSNEAEAGIIGNSVKGVEYQFEKGDNLWNICKILCKSVSRDVTKHIANENGIKNVRRIPKGKKVHIARRYMNSFLVDQTADGAKVTQTDSGQAKQYAGEIQTLQSNLNLALANNNVLETANDNLSEELSDTKVSLAKVAAERGEDQKKFFTVIGILTAVILVMIFFLIKMALDPNRSKELQKSVFDGNPVYSAAFKAPISGCSTASGGPRSRGRRSATTCGWANSRPGSTTAWDRSTRRLPCWRRNSIAG